MTLQQKNYFMWQAIQEGRKALPKCLPNPPIGCVIVKNNTIISRGFTNEPSSPHAEAMALNNLPKDAEGFSIFVTLEPCSFKGRTPSCAKAIVKSKVKDIYIGIIDPHPKNNGKGITILTQSGINVELGILSELIYAELNNYLNDNE